jgi:hypothetical protein
MTSGHQLISLPSPTQTRLVQNLSQNNGLEVCPLRDDIKLNNGIDFEQTNIYIHLKTMKRSALQ